MDDKLLVVRCQLGEREALTELVRAWHAQVWTYVRRMLDEQRADDVSQEVWVAVLRGLPRLKDPARFAPWLFTIARRAVADRLRSEYAQPETPTTDETDPARGQPSLEEALADRAELVGALAGMPVREREVLVLFYLEDFSLNDCAQICGVPVGTIKSRLNRARRLLSDQLTRKENGHELA